MRKSQFTESQIVTTLKQVEGKRPPIPCCTAVAVNLNLPVTRVIRTLERIAAWRGYPAKLRLDNGPDSSRWR